MLADNKVNNTKLMSAEDVEVLKAGSESYATLVKTENVGKLSMTVLFI